MPERSPQVAGQPAAARLMGQVERIRRVATTASDVRDLDAFDVAVVLRALADYTALQAGLAWDGGDPALSIGRWLHAVADDLELPRPTGS